MTRSGIHVWTQRWNIYRDRFRLRVLASGSRKRGKGKLDFFTLDWKKRWKVMPMGALNYASTLVAMVMELQQQWDGLAEDQSIIGCGLEVTIDDVLYTVRPRHVTRSNCWGISRLSLTSSNIIGKRSTSRNTNGSKIIANILESMLEQKETAPVNLSLRLSTKLNALRQDPTCACSSVSLSSIASTRPLWIDHTTLAKG